MGSLVPPRDLGDRSSRDGGLCGRGRRGGGARRERHPGRGEDSDLRQRRERGRQSGSRGRVRQHAHGGPPTAGDPGGRPDHRQLDPDGDRQRLRLRRGVRASGRGARSPGGRADRDLHERELPRRAPRLRTGSVAGDPHRRPHRRRRRRAPPPWRAWRFGFRAQRPPISRRSTWRSSTRSRSSSRRRSTHAADARLRDAVEPASHCRYRIGQPTVGGCILPRNVRWIEGGSRCRGR